MKKEILITGASRGIGLATAEYLAQSGYSVVGTGRGVPESFPGQFYAVDFADSEETAAVLQEIASGHSITGLVNNAGLSQSKTLEETTTENLQAHFDVNLRAAVQCTQAVLPAMKKSGYGRIVNISSRVILGRKERTAYAATKAGLASLTRGWALELAVYNITVNTISPGPVRTELFDRNHPAGSPQYEQLLDTVPLRRFGYPRSIAGPIAFFLSDAADYVTGQNLYVCGGASIGSNPL